MKGIMGDASSMITRMPNRINRMMAGTSHHVFLSLRHRKISRIKLSDAMIKRYVSFSPLADRTISFLKGA